MANMANDLVGKLFVCRACDYNTSRKDQFNRHLTTAKHKRQILANDLGEVKNKFSCKCGKIYNHLCSLCKHKHKCPLFKPVEQVKNEIIISADAPNNVDNKIMKQNELIQTMMLENKELKNAIIELVSKVGSNNNNTVNNTITNNNSFNLNVFLNETCKDAININDFIKNIEIQLKEIENIGNNGYVSGITDIIVSRLNQLDVTKRPVHCTDLKRETLYIKDEDAWNKDTNDNTKMRNVVTSVAKKSYRTIPKWRQENPECQDPENDKYTFCINMMRNTLGELDESHQSRIDDKIIKNVAKLVVVDKNPTI
jgi:hypothetical protein